MLVSTSLGKDFFQMKIGDTFLIFAPNIDCGYSLEPPHNSGSNDYLFFFFFKLFFFFLIQNN